MFIGNPLFDIVHETGTGNHGIHMVAGFEYAVDDGDSSGPEPPGGGYLLAGHKEGTVPGYQDYRPIGR